MMTCWKPIPRNVFIDHWRNENRRCVSWSGPHAAMVPGIAHEERRMSSVLRILTGLEFVLDPATGQLNWPAETEDLVRLSIELARVTHSGLAFAAVAVLPEQASDCGQIDAWMAAAELQVKQLWQSAAAEAITIEQAAWFGNPGQEWAESARDSEMDLLIVPGAPASEATVAYMADRRWIEQAGCPVWFAGREPDRLDAEPPLIVFCDDLSHEAAVHLPFAVELALAWNARLLIVHPLAQSLADLSKDEEDRLRREVFVRLSRTDFRTIPQGSQLRFVTGGLNEIITEVSSEQIPNLVMSSVTHVGGVHSPWRGHLLLWASRSDTEDRDSIAQDV